MPDIEDLLARAADEPSVAVPLAAIERRGRGLRLRRVAGQAAFGVAVAGALALVVTQVRPAAQVAIGDPSPSAQVSAAPAPSPAAQDPASPPAAPAGTPAAAPPYGLSVLLREPVGPGSELEDVGPAEVVPGARLARELDGTRWYVAVDESGTQYGIPGAALCLYTVDDRQGTVACGGAGGGDASAGGSPGSAVVLLSDGTPSSDGSSQWSALIVDGYDTVIYDGEAHTVEGNVAVVGDLGAGGPATLSGPAGSVPIAVHGDSPAPAAPGALLADPAFVGDPTQLVMDAAVYEAAAAAVAPGWGWVPAIEPLHDGFASPLAAVWFTPGSGLVTLETIRLPDQAEVPRLFAEAGSTVWPDGTVGFTAANQERTVIGFRAGDLLVRVQSPNRTAGMRQLNGPAVTRDVLVAWAQAIAARVNGT